MSKVCILPFDDEGMVFLSVAPHIGGDVAGLHLDDGVQGVAFAFIFFVAFQTFGHFAGNRSPCFFAQFAIFIHFYRRPLIHHANERAVNNRRPKLFDKIKDKAWFTRAINMDKAAVGV